MLNHRVLRREAPYSGQVGDGMVVVALLDEEAGRLVVEEAKDEYDASKHDVNGCGNYPGVVGVFIDVQS